MKKAGRYLVSALPLVVMLLTQLLSSVILMIRYMLLYGLDAGLTIYQEDNDEILMLVHFIGILIIGSWYYLAVVRRRQKLGLEIKSCFTWKAAGRMVLIALGSYVLIAVLLLLWGQLAPDMMAEYEAMMEKSGLASFTAASVLCAVVLAPLNEEFTFRGLTMEYLGRATNRFWVINVVQALFFAIAHLNLVQGVYAFLVGLLLGHVAVKYRSIWASVVLHALFNSIGNLLLPLVQLLLE